MVKQRRNNKKEKGESEEKRETNDKEEFIVKRTVVRYFTIRRSCEKFFLIA